MTIEAVLTRKYGITFIDARAIANEAKLTLNIHGYPTPAQKAKVINEAAKIFESQPEGIRLSMESQKDALDMFKEGASIHSSRRSSSSEVDSCEFSIVSSEPTKSSRKKGFKLFRR